MKGARALAGACLAAGIALAALGVATGAMRVGLFLVFPFVSGTGVLPLGVFACFVAAFLLWTSAARPRRESSDAWPPEPEDEPAGAARSGGVVLLGPIPIVWGSDRRILPWMVAAGAALTLGLVVLTVLLR